MKLINCFKDLSKFELVLWIVSVLTIIFSYLFSGSGDYLVIIGSLIGVTALIFVSKGYVLGQVITVIFAVFYGIISFYFKYYGEMITYLCMTGPIAMLAVISWIKHPYKGTKEVEVHTLTKNQILAMIILSVIVTVIFYFILLLLGNANLFFSTISITTSFIASYLTFYRSQYYALAYSANDIVLIILWILAAVENISYFPMIFCFVMFLANDLYGFYNWKRIYKKQTQDM